MNTLTIRPQNQSNTTTIENHFIDTFMPKANGEFVKIYLYLIRIMNDPSSASSLSTIADVLEHTEKDLLRGLSYWEKEGLLKISTDDQGRITAIDIVPASTIENHTMDSGPIISIGNAGATAQVHAHANTAVLPSLDNFSSTSISSVASALAPDNDSTSVADASTTSESKSNEELKQLLFIAQCYLEKPLSKSEVENIQYFYDELNFSAALIDHLIEYCVETKHKSMHYIKAVAEAWALDGVTTVEEAKVQVQRYNKNYKIILRSFGITGRAPVISEVQFMDTWLNEYGMSLEVINEACVKTLNAISQAKFSYANSILKNWHEQNVRTLEDVKRLDEEYNKSKVTELSRRNSVDQAKARPANFEQHNYDFDTINSKLYNVQ